MSDWADSGTWEGDGLRREVFFFASGRTELYGSLFAASEPTRPFGVVACGSWGTEADRTDPLVRSVALAMARLGGAGLVFHYPGYGDSYGDLAELDLADLRDAAVDAAAEADRRCPGLAWIHAGFMLGAAVACLARQRVGEGPLLLVQPALRPGTYFRWLSTVRRPLAPGSSPRELMQPGTAPGMAYGYPIPSRILERAGEADEDVAAALASFRADGAVIHHQEPPLAEPLPSAMERIEVPGTWRFGSQNNPRLARGAARWLKRSTVGQVGSRAVHRQ